jgi:hypothetical protein
MKQYEAIIEAMKQNGGYATLGQLYQLVPKIPNCKWGTKTPFASIRGILQVNDAFFKIRPGLWALTSEKEKVMQIFSDVKPADKTKEYSHYFFQGLVVEIGNFKGFQTFIPAQDKNKPFSQQKLGEVATVSKLYEFTYPAVLQKASTIDVTWFNARKYPHSFFEVEHSTDIYNSLLKFVELQDFRVNFYIVADGKRRSEYESKVSQTAFAPIKPFIKFLDYDALAELHTKVSASIVAEKVL